MLTTKWDVFLKNLQKTREKENLKENIRNFKRTVDLLLMR